MDRNLETTFAEGISFSRASAGIRLFFYSSAFGGCRAIPGGTYRTRESARRSPVPRSSFLPAFPRSAGCQSHVGDAWNAIPCTFRLRGREMQKLRRLALAWASPVREKRWVDRGKGERGEENGDTGGERNEGIAV